jgi:hypothetical protein
MRSLLLFSIVSAWASRSCHRRPGRRAAGRPPERGVDARQSADLGRSDEAAGIDHRAEGLQIDQAIRLSRHPQQFFVWMTVYLTPAPP